MAIKALWGPEIAPTNNDYFGLTNVYELRERVLKHEKDNVVGALTATAGIITRTTISVSPPNNAVAVAKLVRF